MIAGGHRSRSDRIVARHLGITVAIVVSILGAALALEFHLTGLEADRLTRDVASRVAGEVSSELAAADLTDPAADLNVVDDAIDGFFTAGVIARVKVWRVEGDRVRVVYSDERRLVGDVRPFSADLAARLDAEDVVVMPVPDDAEHRFETARGRDLREAFIAFHDRAGTPMRLEVYVHVQRDAWVGTVIALHLPAMILGIVLLIACLLPLSLRLARRLREAERDRRDAIAAGLMARAHERDRLARRLHDDILQDLSGAQLALDALARSADADAETLERLSGILATDARKLRDLIDDEAPDSGTLPLRDAVDAAVRDARGRGIRAEAVMDGRLDQAGALPPDLDRLLGEAVLELSRNVFAHARASSMRIVVTADAEAVRLEVLDDGRGLTPEAARSGHGIRLLERAATLRGGSLHVAPSTPGTVAAMSLPLSTATGSTATGSTAISLAGTPRA